MSVGDSWLTFFIRKEYFSCSINTKKTTIRRRAYIPIQGIILITLNSLLGNFDKMEFSYFFFEIRHFVVCVFYTTRKKCHYIVMFRFRSSCVGCLASELWRHSTPNNYPTTTKKKIGLFPKWL